MPAWPGTLPQNLFRNSVTVGWQDPVLRTPNETGPSKSRRRFTAAARPVSGRMLLNGTQMAAFKSFFENDVAHGALSFDWTDPVDGTAVVLKFLEPPQWNLIRTGSVANRLWEAQLALEIQP